MKVIIPGNTQIYESDLATYWFDAQGILNAIAKRNKRTLKNVQDNFELIKQIAHDKKNCLLIYLNSSAYISKESSKYVAKEIPGIYKAVALVAKSNVAKKVMNIFFKLKPPAVPMKSFTNDSEAKQWLKQFV